jgi:hypothetical protein
MGVHITDIADLLVLWDLCRKEGDQSCDVLRWERRLEGETEIGEPKRDSFEFQVDIGRTRLG